MTSALFDKAQNDQNLEYKKAEMKPIRCEKVK
jgi:hypothetical protein